MRIELELLNARHGPEALTADLVFDPADPFAVTMTFHTPGQRVRWIFGRELLVRGLYEPTGEGDVLVWPSLGDTGDAVSIIELRSPGGSVLVQASSRGVACFVQKMLAVVPEGHEMEFVDLDGDLARLVGD